MIRSSSPLTMLFLDIQGGASSSRCSAVLQPGRSRRVRSSQRCWWSGSSTVSRPHPAHEVGQRLADLIGAVLLKEVAPFHRYFGLVRPSTAELSLPADQNRTGICIDE